MVRQGGRRLASGFHSAPLPRLRRRLGRHDKEAKDAAAQLQKVHPGYTVQTWAGIHWSDNPTFNAGNQRFIEGLRKAGMPEGEKKTN